MIRIKEGDILKAEENIICHQVNCFGKMGAGLAKQIKNKYPKVYEDYNRLCCSHEDNRELFGIIQICSIDKGKYIANLFSQYGYGREKQQTDYNKLRGCLMHLKRQAKTAKQSIAVPYGIGCGLAGGDWRIVKGIIEGVFIDYSVTLYKLN